METLLWVLPSILIGMLIGFLIARIIVKANSVSRSELERIQNEWTREQEQHKYAKEQAEIILQQKEALQIKFEAVQQELSAFRERVDNLQVAGEEKGITMRNLQETIEKDRLQTASLQKTNAELQALNNALKDKLETFDAEMTRKFQILSQQILEEKSKKFTELNKEQMEQVLHPFEKEIKEFREKVNETYDKESKERFSLHKEIEKLMSLNQQLSDDAKNLTRALTTDTKTQGDWGEMILEKILEQSGLTKDREFTMQESMTDNEGNRLRTDVIIKLPEDRNIIIDSKVSLTDYDRYMKSDEKAEQEKFLSQHIRSVRNHIDILHKKSYTDYGGSPEFIFMFVPVEPAFMMAMHGDQEIWNYGFSKGIIVIGPTNLIAALKLVSEIWKKEKQSKNAIEIAEKAGSLYDKFVGFADNLLDIGKNLDKASESYSKALGQLKDGKGNILNRVEQLRKLGAKGKKQLDAQLLLDPDEFTDPDTD